MNKRIEHQKYAKSKPESAILRLTRYDYVKTQSDMQTDIIIYFQSIQFKWIVSFLYQHHISYTIKTLFFILSCFQFFQKKSWEIF